MFGKVQSKDDVEGRQQERRKVVENVMSRMEERRKDEGEGVQGSWSDEVNGEGTDATNLEILWIFY